ncbi:DUF1778 domain-containing protein [Wenzhouxiangella limi]|uniref:type II toxin -antitoxin system TacA 1-like antitoxin n=1 Tax=Wenzhouxiangella limi TaxID=2707351 RepID=UPI0019418672
MTTAAQEAAQRAIAEADVIRLSLADQARFADALLSPPQMPVPVFWLGRRLIFVGCVMSVVVDNYRRSATS